MSVTTCYNHSRSSPHTQVLTRKSIKHSDVDHQSFVEQLLKKVVRAPVVAATAATPATPVGLAPPAATDTMLLDQTAAGAAAQGTLVSAMAATAASLASPHFGVGAVPDAMQGLLGNSAAGANPQPTAAAPMWAHAVPSRARHIYDDWGAAAAAAAARGAAPAQRLGTPCAQGFGGVQMQRMKFTSQLQAHQQQLASQLQGLQAAGAPASRPGPRQPGGDALGHAGSAPAATSVGKCDHGQCTGHCTQCTPDGSARLCSAGGEPVASMLQAGRMGSGGGAAGYSSCRAAQEEGLGSGSSGDLPPVRRVGAPARHHIHHRQPCGHAGSGGGGCAPPPALLGVGKKVLSRAQGEGGVGGFWVRKREKNETNLRVREHRCKWDVRRAATAALLHWSRPGTLWSRGDL